MGVLEHSLDTFGIANKDIWTPYLKDYKTKPENVADKFDAHSYARDIYKLIDSVIINVDDSDL
jgi:hypothetical protein